MLDKKCLAKVFFFGRHEMSPKMSGEGPMVKMFGEAQKHFGYSALYCYKRHPSPCAGKYDPLNSYMRNRRTVKVHGVIET